MNPNEEVVCAKVWLKPASEARVREWAKYTHGLSV